ncbi:hypothetical protein Dsin_021027 [Dipteronia sinensis]|uniref:Reverse transcriptase n=1 Tax=Dipteronia sinensis TaxID=43782 RepID=A0AAE0E4J1_9ROSI|nr:hypothetical protein Dsin_021027 [Dipteronia sinensis]
MISFSLVELQVNSCFAIKEVMEIYEKGSGQKVNLQKSCITFSPNAREDVKSVVQSTLGLIAVQSHDRYLGLPTLVEKNKRTPFKDIKERVWNKVRSWKSNLFSIGGKEILIKVVAQDVPTYAMSIFQLPNSLCKELCSFIIRDLLMKGVRWKVGDEEKIRAFASPWLPRPTSFIPIIKAPGEEVWVKDLLQNSGQMWDMEKLNLFFLDIDKESILSIPLSYKKVFKVKKGSNCSTSQVARCPPPRGSLKLKTDAAVKQNSTFIGIGAAIRDGDGKVIVALSKPISSIFDG